MVPRTAPGIGLDYGTVRLARTTEEWLSVGSQLRAQVSEQLDGGVTAVEHIGSSSVVGILAKPIIDLAVGLGPDHGAPEVGARLEAAGWIFRGNAGDDGGLVFVLETRPWYRVAHLHVVEHGGAQWSNYLRLRDLLTSSSEARDRYETVKLRLAQAYADDRSAYTNGKSTVVRSLLEMHP